MILFAVCVCMCLYVCREHLTMETHLHTWPSRARLPVFHFSCRQLTKAWQIQIAMWRQINGLASRLTHCVKSENWQNMWIDTVILISIPSSSAPLSLCQLIRLFCCCYFYSQLSLLSILFYFQQMLKWKKQSSSLPQAQDLNTARQVDRLSS